jgi:hypothetical protein
VLLPEKHSLIKSIAREAFASQDGIIDSDGIGVNRGSNMLITTTSTSMADNYLKGSPTRLVKKKKVVANSS